MGNAEVPDISAFFSSTRQMPSESRRAAPPKKTGTAGSAGRPTRARGRRALPSSGAKSADPAAPGPNFIRVLRQFRELFRVSQQHFQRVEATCGVSGAQLWALCEIEEEPGMTVSDIARKLSIHLSTASNLLDKLEAKNLVKRERASADQRVVRVFIMREGMKVLKRAPGPAEGVIPDALQKMPERALARLHADLGRVLELASIRRPREGLKHLTEP